MHYAASAYSRTAQTGQTPRELEASILMKSASRLQGIRDDWANRSGELDEALTYNRKLWTVLVSSVTRPENPLPTPIKQNMVNLGLFIFNHTLSLMASPAPERIGILVSINRELAAGLRGMGVPEESAAA
ncbi:flagellar biosynthesis regulator FlaF [Microvirga massiliensis]|uniref:flagellar biosynthesis regulator FlaF n=1 Tax=Microvirga massiliensis TaxID=1033741 RepID=UPI00062B750E|nr:flagellar biosynthesis regulator FlaF [Microvirga massiliensis]